MGLTEYDVVVDKRKLENIANAIRVKNDSGGAEPKYTLEQMEQEILGFNNMPNMKRWDIEIAEEMTVATRMLADEWLKEHRTDENLNVLIIKKDTVNTNDYTHGVYLATYCRNRPLYIASERISYGMSIRKKNDDISHSANIAYNTLTSKNDAYGGQIYIGESGSLSIMCTSGYRVVAGSYYVLAWLE